MDAFDSLEQPLCDYNESMDALPELWETDSFQSVSFFFFLSLNIVVWTSVDTTDLKRSLF